MCALSLQIVQGTCLGDSAIHLRGEAHRTTSVWAVLCSNCSVILGLPRERLGGWVSL